MEKNLPELQKSEKEYENKTSELDEFEEEVEKVLFGIYSNVVLWRFELNSENPVIYHYCSPESLKEIIKEKKLRFTRFDCFCDVNEGKEVIEKYIEVCKELSNEEEIDSDFYKIIKNVMPICSTKEEGPILFFSDSSDILPLDEEYVCCFSLNPDSIPMWNHYVKGNKYEGYNIGTAINDWFKEVKDTDLEFIKVIYDDDEKKKILKKCILNVYKDRASLGNRKFLIQLSLSLMLNSV